MDGPDDPASQCIYATIFSEFYIQKSFETAGFYELASQATPAKI